jgi:plastocyanin
MLFPSPKELSVPVCRRYVPRRTRYPRLSVLLIALPLIIACSSATAPSANPAPPEGTQQLVIRGQDTMRFALPAPVVEAGKPVQVVFENEGQLVHDVSFQEGLPAGSDVKVLASGKARAVSRAFTFERPGTYRFTCSQPGHEAAGMHGAIAAR